MSERPDLTITIVSWNTRDLLRACLQSVATEEQRINVEVHVVDNASGDGSAEMVRREFPQVYLIANQENVGFARANDQSWPGSQGRYWMLLNSDAEARPGSLEALVDFLDAHPRAGLATARLVSLDESPQHCAQPPVSLWRPLAEALRLHKLMPNGMRARWFLGPYFSYDVDSKIGWTWGTALIARREAVEKVGPLSEKFFMYGEDLEWCLRMRRGGWEIWFCAEAEVLHHGAQSSVQQWSDAVKQQIVLDAIYRAVEMQRGRVYLALLHLATLWALRIERLLKRLGGTKCPGMAAMIDYHRQALSRSLWT